MSRGLLLGGLNRRVNRAQIIILRMLSKIGCLLHDFREHATLSANRALDDHMSFREIVVSFEAKSV